MKIADRKLKLAFNPGLIDKNQTGDASLFSVGWVNSEVTADEFTSAVSEHGWAYCAQLRGARKAANFLASNIASVDVDHGLTIDAALTNPFVRKHATLLYTTARHTLEHNRFRVVFQLPETIVRASKMRAINRGLSRRLGGDMAATDPTRISFGNSGAEVHYIGGEVSPELLRELVTDATLPENTDLPDREIVSSRSCVMLDHNRQLRLADGRVMPLSDIPSKTRVHCPVHPDDNASAFIVESRRGLSGVYCSTCSKTYWPDGAGAHHYDPDAFVRTAREIAMKSSHVASLESGWLCDDLVVGRVHIVNGKPAPAALLNGITLIRSDKGTGKTEAMRRLSQGVKSVLLISHRRTLVRGSCKRLGLACYLDLQRKAEEPSTDFDDVSHAPFTEEGGDEA